MAAMNEANADYVYPIIALGLRVKDRLSRGQELDLDLMQREFIRLLDQGVGGGDGSSVRHRRRRPGVVGSAVRAGVLAGRDLHRGGLAVVGGVASPLAGVLAVPLGGGGRQFPAQSELALRTRGSDVVEAFFLCWMLGFRGRLREDLEELGRATWSRRGRRSRGR